jgi:NAD(P)-dependent dehydrogenase (short-subunit alcohol dehydrogenase family)
MSQDTRGNTRTVVITGGNSGLGYGCARAILGSNNGPWHVVIASRDADREQTAVDALAAGAAAGHTGGGDGAGPGIPRFGPVLRRRADRAAGTTAWP